MSNETRNIFGGDWTKEKLEMLEDYLSAYTTIMKEQPFRFGYIDAFAGTGYIRDEPETDEQTLFPVVEEEERRFLEGSVRTALEAEPPLNAYVFIEQNEEAYNELVQIRDEYPEKDITCVNEDANEWLMDRCLNRNWDRHRAVVFLDPFGMQVRWDTVQAIADTEAIDLWILFPLGIGANRLLTKDGDIPEGWRRTLTEVFGTEQWEDRFYETTQTLFGEAQKKVIDLEGIGEFYIERLEDEFAEVAPNPRPLYNSRGNPMYLLCFAAGNPTGAPTAVKIAQHILEP
jgi:three-Cys-motif partner protein